MRFAVPMLVFAACATEPSVQPDPGATSHVVRRDVPLLLQHRLDLMFVVDNSPAMAPHREALLANARAFVDVLANEPGGLPDLHLAVITTGGTDCSQLGDAATMTAAGARGHDYFTDVRIPGGEERDYDGDLGDALAETFEQLPVGCAIPRPLEAMRRALDTNPSNAGFLREDAYLAVMFLTATDDCSFADPAFLEGADPFRCIEQPGALIAVDDYAAFLHGLKADPAQVALGGAFGPAEPRVIDPQTRSVEPSCTSGDGARSAEPATRLHALFDRFPNRAADVSLCEPDLSGALDVLATLVKQPLGVPCFDEPLDLDVETPGLQTDCASWLEIGADREQQVLRECTADTTDTCWRLFEDRACLDGLRLSFDHYVTTSEPTSGVIECVAR